MTQCERILRHMQEVGGITAAEAVQEYGVYRLAARIADIKKAGYPVKRETVKGKNRYGEPVHFSRYSLEVKHCEQ